MKAAKIVLLVLGILFMLAAMGYCTAGAAVLWFRASHESGDGFIMSGEFRIDRDVRAVSSRPIRIHADSRWIMRRIGLAAVRLECSAVDGTRMLFVGIAPERDAYDYLRGVDHDVVESLRFYPARLRYVNRPGDEEPAPPGDQDFWVASTSGAGDLSLEWDVESGYYVALVMNADGSAGVRCDARVGARLAGLLAAAGAALIIAGAAGIAGSALMLFFALRREGEQAVSSQDDESAVRQADAGPD